MSSTVKVVITGAAGQIGYSLVPLVCSGQVFGEDTRVVLHLLDIAMAEQSLKGVAMEIEDGAYPLVEKVVATSSVEEAFTGVQYAILVGGFPRKAGMERKELIAKNVTIFKEQGQALNNFADRNCKVLVVANPANTNAYICSHFAPNIPKQNFSCLTRLDHNRALTQIALKTNTPVDQVKNVIIWGNHSSTQYPDVNHGTVRGQPIRQVVADDAYLNGPYISTVQKRGAAIIEARKLSSAMSAANAVKDHMHDWVKGTPEGSFVSMGVITDVTNNAYGIEAGVCYSFPMRCRNGQWEIVEGLPIDEFSRNLMNATLEELKGEKVDAMECITA